MADREDALVMGPWHHTEERAERYRRPPMNYEAEHCLLRTVRCVSGAVELSVLCEPVFDYGGAGQGGSSPAPHTGRS